MAERTGHCKGLAGGVAAAVLCLVPSLGWTADDPRDAAFLEPVLQRTLETARTDVEVPWSNPVTGSRGGFIVERTFYRAPETPCRAYVRTLEPPGGAAQVTRGTGCRSPTGLWMIEEQPETFAAPEPAAGPPPAATASTRGVEPDAMVEAGPACPDTVRVPMPAVRPPAFAYTLPSRAEL